MKTLLSKRGRAATKVAQCVPPAWENGECFAGFAPYPAQAGRAALRSAFTLIELVISAALASMILVGGYMCLSAGFATQKLIEPRAEIIQSARDALALMSADLRAA